jgi:hypothetical protein
MEKSSRNEIRITKKLSKKGAYVIGLIIVFGSDFILRDVFLPEHAKNIHIGKVVLVEWMILSTLLTFWIPKIEGNNLESIGFGKFKWKHLWIGILTYLILMLVWTGNCFALNSIGLERVRSLQPKNISRKHLIQRRIQ